MPWSQSTVTPVTSPFSTAPTSSPFSYYAFDFLTGRLMGQVPFRGVSFGQQLNTPGTLSATLDLRDPRLVNANPLSCTVPNRTIIAVDYQGAIVWAGWVLSRKWDVDASGGSTTGLLNVQCAELWSYFQQRVQATDYSSPPTSGITGGGGTMAMWNPGPTGGPWDASLIACQVISDALGYSDSATEPYGNPLGSTTVLLNGATPTSSKPAAPAGDYVAVMYPFTTCQTVDMIVTQLSQLGLGVGFDFGVDVAYSSGVASAPVATVNISYPRRGRTVARGNLQIDLTLARKYSFPEDGSQAANQVYEVGGSSAIVVSANANAYAQGYPLIERVISRGSLQSQNIIQLLGQTGRADLALYAYAPVVPTVTLAYNDPNLPLGAFTVGDDVQVWLPSTAGDGHSFDPRFPAGLDQEWRITSWQADIKDEGDATVTYTLNQPPLTAALAPAI